MTEKYTEFTPRLTKDYSKVGKRVMKLGKFGKVEQCGSPSKYYPVHLIFHICEAYIIGYSFNVIYDGICRKWQINYSLNPNPEGSMRIMDRKITVKMDRELYMAVENVLNLIRRQCGVIKAPLENSDKPE